ncbi:hypothetical protein GHT07_20640 [Caenimonas koreensis DSM 17982]|uniref:Uncharacterized protein n=1 Tax=Caenimonas koreensis DSM 17982 TaxID=1121255 RepID=A0A844AZB4_9BURK|nr:hypothetical protein [Caenimonas koreensis]MRD49685.1 hypothetical protein [Caenimonas koreensis DSM 17982]
MTRRPSDPPSHSASAVGVPPDVAALGLPWRLDIQHGYARFLRVDGRPALGVAVDLDSDEGLALLASPDLRVALLQYIVKAANGLQRDAFGALRSLSEWGGLAPRPGDPPGLAQAQEAALAALRAYERSGAPLTSAEGASFASWFEAAYHDAAAPVAATDLAGGRHKTTAFAWALHGYRRGIGAI